MSDFVKSGRWAVALFFELQGLSILYDAIKMAVATLRAGSGTFYPTYEHLIEALAFLLCSWGLLKMRSWAYWLAMGICLLEFSVGMGVITRGAFSERLHFEFASTLIPALIAGGCLVWLFLPEVRAQYLQKEFAA
jgi:hypothetical protein